MPEMVRIQNKGLREFRDGYANITYRVPVGDAIIVPWGAACLWFGNPELIDKPHLSQFDRRDEIERLYARMGCYDGDDKTIVQRFDENRPSVEVQTLEGETLIMLVEGMDGTPNVIADITSLPRVDEREALASELARMKAMQAELLSRLSILEAGEESFDELPVDSPKQVPVDN